MTTPEDKNERAKLVAHYNYVASFIGKDTTAGLAESLGVLLKAVLAATVPECGSSEQEPHGPGIDQSHGLACYGCGLIALRESRSAIQPTPVPKNMSPALHEYNDQTSYEVWVLPTLSENERDSYYKGKELASTVSTSGALPELTQDMMAAGAMALQQIRSGGLYGDGRLTDEMAVRKMYAAFVSANGKLPK